MCLNAFRFSGNGGSCNVIMLDGRDDRRNMMYTSTIHFNKKVNGVSHKKGVDKLPHCLRKTHCSTR